MAPKPNIPRIRSNRRLRTSLCLLPTTTGARVKADDIDSLPCLCDGLGKSTQTAGWKTQDTRTVADNSFSSLSNVDQAYGMEQVA